VEVDAEGDVAVVERATVALHELTGFEGRCDAILFCKDVGFKPVEDLAALTRFRRKQLHLPDEPADDLLGNCFLYGDRWIDIKGVVIRRA
jgi:hypothetical protein